ncbi:MAG TPA: hypothetical protein VHR45_07780 [Thermoanaerobaculia bacterium]|nr:hypothetical protein [Thermoanaerobaculia bacterium]
MRYRRLIILTIVPLLSVAGVVGAGEVQPVAGAALGALDLQPLKGAAATLHWDGPQFIQADARGNVFLLRGDTLEVYPVTKSHDLGEPVRLEISERSGSPLDAAISPQGNWVVNMGRKVHYFVDGSEKLLPELGLGLGQPITVGFLRDDPVVMVVPMPYRGAAGDDDRRGLPLLVRAGQDSWSTELREALHGSPDDRNTERGYRAAMVLDAQRGRYFLARQYAYRIELRRLGRDRPLEELRLAKGELVFKKLSDEQEKRLLGEFKSEAGEGGKVNLFLGSNSILALARNGRAGPVYALLGSGIAGKQCALDRIDWDEQRVERVALNLPCVGRASMAAGRDGLFFAEWNGERGRFFASWDALDQAKWSAVKEAVFNP